MLIYNQRNRRAVAQPSTARQHVGFVGAYKNRSGQYICIELMEDWVRRAGMQVGKSYAIAYDPEEKAFVIEDNALHATAKLRLKKHSHSTNSHKEIHFPFGEGRAILDVLPMVGRDSRSQIAAADVRPGRIMVRIPPTWTVRLQQPQSVAAA